MANQLPPSSLEDPTIKYESRQGGLIEVASAQTHLVGNLWIGIQPTGLGDTDRFTYLVNLNHKTEYYPLKPHQRRIYAPFEDNDTDPKAFNAAFVEAIAISAERMAAEAPTLVHCHAGVNRSGLVCALVMVRQGMAPEEALKLMRTRRSPAMLKNVIFREWFLKHPWGQR